MELWRRAAIATGGGGASEGWRTAQERAGRAALLGARARRLARLHATVAVPVDPSAPVSHVSWFERTRTPMRGARLPTEQEWEHAAAELPISGHFQESGISSRFPPRTATARSRDVRGHVGSGRRARTRRIRLSPLPGAVGEYNGKFMINQLCVARRLVRDAALAIRASYGLLPPRCPLAILRYPPATDA